MITRVLKISSTVGVENRLFEIIDTIIEFDNNGTYYRLDCTGQMHECTSEMKTLLYGSQS